MLNEDDRGRKAGSCQRKGRSGFVSAKNPEMTSAASRDINHLDQFEFSLDVYNR
jgi:hypothetical protein